MLRAAGRTSAAAAVLAGLFGLSSQADAQSTNYSEVEQLFGEPITTSATGSPLRQSEAPVTMDIVTADDIQRSGARTIPQILERLSGLDVFTWSNNSADVAVRGLNQGSSGRLLLLINGREQYTDALGTIVYQFLPVRLDEIRQIEVVKGPNSALYGFNAAGGVINIITYSPRYDNVNVERASGGSNDYFEGSLIRTQSWDGGGVRLSTGYGQIGESSFHPAYTPDLLAAKVDPSITRTANVDLQQQLGANTELRLQGSYAGSTLRSQAQVPFRLSGIVGSGAASITSDTRFGTIDGSVSYNHYELPGLQSSFGARGPTNNVTVTKLQDLFKIGANDTLRFAAEYRYDTMTSWPDPGGLLSSQDVALSASWIHAFTPNLTLLNAVRGDHFSLNRTGSFVYGVPYTNSDYDRTITDGSFNSAIVWRPTQLDSVKLAVARGLQLPSLTEFGLQGSQVSPFMPPYLPTIQADYIGNPTLPPSVVMNYEASYQRQLPLDASVRLAAFHQDVRDLRTVGPFTIVPSSLAPGSLGALAIAPYEVLGDASINGLEIDVKGKFGSTWRWSANYSLEHVHSTVPVFITDYAASAPTSKVNLQLGYTRDKWEADGYLRYVSRVFLPQQVAPDVFQPTAVNSFVAVQGRLAYHITPKLLAEAVVASGYADNPVARQQTQGFVSVRASF